MTIITTINKIIKKLTGRTYPYPRLQKDLFLLSRKQGYNRIKFQDEIIDIVLLTLNRKDDTVRTLNSLFQTTVRFNLIIIDQNSDDGTKEYLREFVKNKANTKLILLEDNIGVSGGRAKAIEYCTSNYVAFIDNDMIFIPGYFENLLSCLQASSAAATLGKIILPNEQIELNHPSIKISEEWIEFYDEDKEKHYNDTSTFKQGSCDWIPGVALWRKNVLTKYPIDKELIGGYEDNEYSYRVSKQGLAFINCPSALVIHIRAEFTKALLDTKYTIGRHNQAKLQLAAKKFYQKHGYYLSAGKKEDFIKNIGFKDIGSYISFVKSE